jgi:hypothetical protein
MEKNPDVNVEKLAEGAKSSDDGEGYVVVARGDNFKIGLIARIEENSKMNFSMELLVQLLEDKRQVDPSRIKNVMDIVGILIDRGYYLTSEEGGWIFGEYSATYERIKDEMEFLISLIEENIPR